MFLTYVGQRDIVMHVYDDINAAAVHDSDKNIIHEY